MTKTCDYCGCDIDTQLHQYVRKHGYIFCAECIEDVPLDEIEPPAQEPPAHSES